MVNYIENRDILFNSGQQYPIIGEIIERFHLNINNYKEHEEKIKHYRFMSNPDPLEWNNLMTAYLKELLIDSCKKLINEKEIKFYDYKLNNKQYKELIKLKDRISNEKELDNLYNLITDLYDIHDERKASRMSSIQKLFYGLIGLIIGLLVDWLFLGEGFLSKIISWLAKLINTG